MVDTVLFSTLLGNSMQVPFATRLPASFETYEFTYSTSIGGNAYLSGDDISEVAMGGPYGVDRQRVSDVYFELVVPNNYEPNAPFQIVVGCAVRGEFLDGDFMETLPGARVSVTSARVHPVNASTSGGIFAATEGQWQTVTPHDTRIFAEFTWNFEPATLNPGDRLLLNVSVELNSHDENVWGSGYISSVRFGF